MDLSEFKRDYSIGGKSLPGMWERRDAAYYKKHNGLQADFEKAKEAGDELKADFLHASIHHEHSRLVAGQMQDVALRADEDSQARKDAMAKSDSAARDAYVSGERMKELSQQLDQRDKREVSMSPQAVSREKHDKTFMEKDIRLADRIDREREAGNTGLADTLDLMRHEQQKEHNASQAASKWIEATQSKHPDAELYKGVTAHAKREAMQFGRQVDASPHRAETRAIGKEIDAAVAPVRAEDPAVAAKREHMRGIREEYQKVIDARGRTPQQQEQQKGMSL